MENYQIPSPMDSPKKYMFILSPDIFKIIVYERKLASTLLLAFGFCTDKQKKMILLTIINAQRRRKPSLCKNLRVW